MKPKLYKLMSFSFVLVFVISVMIPSFASAQSPEVRFVSVTWTGVTVKTELAVNILETLGYDATNTSVSVPIVYQALATNEADVFLGNWMPSMAYPAQKYFENGTVEKFVANMPGAKYTLAVPTFVAEAGLRHFEDIAKYGDELSYKIYGIEAGNDGNKIIDAMIEQDMFNLGEFELIPSSEVGMLSQVQSFIQQGKWIVFLGWSPHHMNQMIDMTYLQGSTDDTFGPNDGTATVYTNIRAGLAEEQPNVAAFLRNLTFPISMMNEIMTMLHEDENLEPEEAGLLWIKAHPDIYRGWLEGIKTVDGKDALPAFEAFLEGLQL